MSKFLAYTIQLAAVLLIGNGILFFAALISVKTFGFIFLGIAFLSIVIAAFEVVTTKTNAW